jgi:mono/diheme cytochrome c family protein
MRQILSLFGLLVGLVLTQAAPPPEKLPPDHAAKMTASAKLFAEKVGPFFKQNCLECHGSGKIKGGFDLSTRESMLQESDRGKAVIPGKGRESDLVKYVLREQEPHMPPKKPVAKEEVEHLIKWIDLGAAFDKPLIETGKTKTKTAMVVTPKDKQYWAYKPLAQVEVPQVRNASWVRTDLDRFILAKLEKQGIQPAAELSKRQLIRRVTLDLTGLPPTPEDVEAFLKDTSAQAYEKVVDRLLNSPHFGERWARHWQDPARFAESHGFEHDYTRPFAYHYRDFLIRALNADMPYNQFVQWQIAGDELAPNDPLALAATGFLGAGVFPTQITTSEAERVRYDAMDDMLSTTGHTILALTVGCARCHDHKYDPIPTRDYYRMLSSFTSTIRAEIEVDLGTPEEQAATKAFDMKNKPLVDELKRYENQELPKVFLAWLAARHEKKEALPKIPDGNSAKALQALRDKKQSLEKLPKPQRDALLKWFAPQDPEWLKKQAVVAESEKNRPKNTKVKMQVTSEGVKPMRHHTAVGEIPDFYPETFQLKRGDPTQKEGVVTQGFLQVLANDADTRWLTSKPAEVKSSFRRTGMAKFLTDTEKGAGALAARVIVNRLWHHHFGRGIVSTLNDFGFQGDTPSHPELLEWLANDLVQNGWKLKRIHKLIVMSKVYQLGGNVTDTAKSLDPDNKLWHSVPRRRLEAEAIRDSLLAVSGQLDPTMYGAGTLDEGMKRRSIYFQVKRSQMIPMLQVFDWPDTLTSAAARSTTVVAPQALLFMNNPHIRGYANSLAARLKQESDVSKQIDKAYSVCFARLPSDAERAAGLEFLKSRPADKGLQEYTLALLSLNEFIFID